MSNTRRTRRFRYHARYFYDKNVELKQSLDQIKNGYFSPENPELFHDVVNSLLCDNGDQYVFFFAHPLFYAHCLVSSSYMLLADYESYMQCQDRVNELFKVCSRLLARPMIRFRSPSGSRGLDEEVHFEHCCIGQVLE